MSKNHTTPSTAADLSNEKFGLELEFFGMTRECAADVIAQFLGGQAYYEGGIYSAHSILAPDGKKWTVVSDTSISNSPDFSGDTCELNTPLLGWNDLETVCRLVDCLKQAGAKTNGDFCGIHVHIQEGGHTPETLRNLVNLVNANEDLLTAALGISSARRETWCRPVDHEFLCKLNAAKPESFSKLAQVWYGTKEWRICAAQHYHSSRYHLLNLHSFFQGKGIEFRAFNSTLDSKEVLADIQLCMALNAKAKAVKTASPNRPVTDNPKYTFRCLLLRLGMSGDAFKISRECLIRRLTGNSAWRHAA